MERKKATALIDKQLHHPSHVVPNEAVAPSKLAMRVTRLVPTDGTKVAPAASVVLRIRSRGSLVVGVCLELQRPPAFKRLYGVERIRGVVRNHVHDSS